MNSDKTTKYLIIHGHFYQPPRENPWTERIDRQPSAAPYHDWNERITTECYRPNTHSRRLDGAGRITKLLNNYEWMSFNFGPTLLSWIEETYPDTYEKIIEADRSSAERLGHGNAIAQAYNHIIMPLATRRDQETQIRWGVHDFRRRFGREPAGIWLPETAVNDSTVEILIDFGFDFILLSPHQAQRIRPLDESSDWRDVSGGSIPTGLPHRCFPSRRKTKRAVDKHIVVFFYDAQISVDVSFNHLLRNGDQFARAIADAYPRTGNDLVTIATDGEIYGHHEPFADMALSYLADTAARSHGLSMTNFSAYLESHEPVWEVQLKPGPDKQGTAWSCVHGVGRWKEACGCNLSGGPKENQRWRKPLRNGLNALRDALSDIYESESGTLLGDPWNARDDYITVIENRTPESIERFIAEHAGRTLSPEERLCALSLLESQRNALLMFTSCGWFFDDISGIESSQILKYAARAIELAGGKNKDELDRILKSELKKANSMSVQRGTGVDVYRSTFDESFFGTRSVVGQYAITRHLFFRKADADIFGYTFRQLDTFTRNVDGCAIEARCVEVTSPITLDTSMYQYLLAIEDHTDFQCLLKSVENETEFAEVKKRLSEAPREMDRDSMLKTMQQYFDGRQFTLLDLLPDDREKVLRCLIGTRIEKLKESIDDLYDENKDLLETLSDSVSAPPYMLVVLASTVLTNMLVSEVIRWERSLVPVQLEGIQKIIAEASRYGIPIDKTCATESFSDLILEKTRVLEQNLDGDLIESLNTFVEFCNEYGIALDVHEIQNVIYSTLQTRIAPFFADDGNAPSGERYRGADTGIPLTELDRDAAAGFLKLAQMFNFNVDELVKRLSGR